MQHFNRDLKTWKMDNGKFSLLMAHTCGWGQYVLLAWFSVWEELDWRSWWLERSPSSLGMFLTYYGSPWTGLSRPQDRDPLQPLPLPVPPSPHLDLRNCRKRALSWNILTFGKAWWPSKSVQLVVSFTIKLQSLSAWILTKAEIFKNICSSG